MVANLQNVTITINSGEFATVTPGVIRQVRRLLQVETVKVIQQVERKQPGDNYVVRVDGRWGVPIAQAVQRIQAFWQYPVDGDILRKVWALINEETYKYPTRRTGRLGGSWRAYYRPPKKSGRSSSIPIGNRILPILPPGAGISFVNEAKYGSLMSRWSAMAALRQTIGKKVSKLKPHQPIKLDRLFNKITRSVLYHNTPRGYSTVTRIASRARRFALRAPVLIRAFDLPPTGGSQLKRISGISVTALRNIRISDITKQGRG